MSIQRQFSAQLQFPHYSHNIQPSIIGHIKHIIIFSFLEDNTILSYQLLVAGGAGLPVYFVFFANKLTHQPFR